MSPVTIKGTPIALSPCAMPSHDEAESVTYTAILLALPSPYFVKAVGIRSGKTDFESGPVSLGTSNNSDLRTSYVSGYSVVFSVPIASPCLSEPHVHSTRIHIQDTA